MRREEEPNRQTEESECEREKRNKKQKENKDKKRKEKIKGLFFFLLLYNPDNTMYRNRVAVLRFIL